MSKKLIVAVLVFVAAASLFGAAAVKPTELSLFVEGNPNIDPAKDIVLKAMGEATNTILKVEMPPGSGFNERLQILLASGDLPDIVQFAQGTIQMHKQAAEDGLVIAIDEYLKKAPWIMKAVEQNTWISMKLLNDGKIYGIPKGTMNRQDGVAVRLDWLKKFGMSIPSNGIVTMDNFMTILRRFTNDDPDGNGKKDTYGINIAPTQIFNAGTFRVLGWQRATVGPYKYMHAQWDKYTTNFKDALQFNQTLSKEGLTNPDWQAGAAMDQWLAGQNGITGSLAGNLPPRIAILKKNFPKAEVDYIARIVLKAGDEPAGSGFANGAMWGQLAITKACKDRGRVEKAISFLDWICDPKGGWDIVTNGLSGVHYTVASGKKVFNAEYDKFVGVRKTYAFLRPYADLRFAIGPANMDEAAAAELLRWTENSAVSLYQTRDQGYTPAAARAQSLIDYTPTVEETITKISLGQLPVSAWDACLDGWYKAGGEALVKEINAYIEKYNP